MKKSILTIALLVSGLFVASLVMTGCGTKKEQTSEEATDSTSNGDMKMDATAMTYACPMHPEITGKEGDKCSKCKMDLEAVNNADTTKHEH